DWRRVRQARNRRLPADIFPGPGIPRGRQRRGIVDAAGVRAAVLGPVFTGSSDRHNKPGCGEQKRSGLLHGASRSNVAANRKSGNAEGRIGRRLRVSEWFVVRSLTLAATTNLPKEKRLTSQRQV